MDDEGFADPPTEWAGNDKGTKRGWGCVLIVVVNGAAWTLIYLLARSLL